MRNLEKAQAALKDDLEPGHLKLLEMDMGSFSSVRACAEEFLSKSNHLHILIANAGVMITPEGKTADGFELQSGTNHLAHFLLFQLLKPTFLASATPGFSSRVISLSSVIHRVGEFDFSDPNKTNFTNKPYDPAAAYSQSKHAALYMANEIDRRYGAANLHAFIVMLGGIWTGLQASLPDEVTSMWPNDEEFMEAFKNPEQGAATSIWGAIARELEGKGGLYLEDCAVAEPAPAPMGDSTADMSKPEYAEWAFDKAKAKALRKINYEMIGTDKQ